MRLTSLEHSLMSAGLQKVTGKINKPGTSSGVCWGAEGYR